MSVILKIRIKQEVLVGKLCTNQPDMSILLIIITIGRYGTAA